MGSPKHKQGLPSFTDYTSIDSAPHNNKYVLSHKVTSQSEASTSSILRKVKLPRRDYENIVKKQQERSDALNNKKRKMEVLIFAEREAS